jgi:hypothetical protein
MNPAIFVWLIYALWLALVAYLTVSAIGVKPNTQGHLLQSFGVMPQALPLFCFRILRDFASLISRS